MLRRRTPLKPSRGTTWPPAVRRVIEARDNHRCVGAAVGFPIECHGTPVELDHVRASGAVGKKSRSTVDNGVLLDPWCHEWKTNHGREARPLLIAWIDKHAALAEALSALEGIR